MKNYLPILFMLIFSEKFFAQTSAQLDINNINATVNAIYKPLFHGANNQAGFEAPKGSGRTSIYASSLWIGGTDFNSQLHLSAQLFSGRDFIPGPIMDFAQYASQIPQWNRVWKIERADILNHVSSYNQPGYTMPADFTTWPAHGNTSFGQAQNLAPFHDNDNNGIYDPYLGDYPLVPGDECIYFIFNDDTIHTESGGLKMGIEVHAFVYLFNCSADSALQNTVFVKYKIINRSTATYYNTSIGIFTDTDLGGSIDDYIACNVEKGYYYVMNGDSIDENYQGTYGYGDSLASQAVVFLAGPHQDTDGIDNPLTTNVQDAIDSLGIPYPGLGINYGDGIIDNERIGMSGFGYFTMAGQGHPATTDPANANDYYNYLTGYWRDNSHMVYGVSGHISTGGTLDCNYMFPGDSDPLNWGTSGIAVSSWDEINSGNVPGDRRGVGRTGNFTFTPGQTEEIDLAYVFARDCINLNDPQASVQVMNTRIDSIRNYFIMQQTPCYTFYTYAGVEENANELSVAIYPNPSSQQFTIDYQGKEINLHYSIHDILGKEITSGQVNSSQTQIDCSNWSKGVYLIKIKNENGYSLKKLIIQ